MRTKFLFILLLILSAAHLSAERAVAQTETPSDPEITAPNSGAALQGLVQINLSVSGSGYQRAELAFSYASDPNETWFLIWESDQPLETGELTVWDTTTITDGDYDLRLMVTDPQGETRESIVRGLHVRNYTPIETSTPAPAQPGTPTATSTTTPQPTNTPLPSGSALDSVPANPASLSPGQIQTVLLRSGLVVLLAFLLGGVYVFLRSRLRNRVR